LYEVTMLLLVLLVFLADLLSRLLFDFVLLFCDSLYASLETWAQPQLVVSLWCYLEFCKNLTSDHFLLSVFLNLFVLFFLEFFVLFFVVVVFLVVVVVFLMVVVVVVIHVFLVVFSMLVLGFLVVVVVFLLLLMV